MRVTSKSGPKVAKTRRDFFQILNPTHNANVARYRTGAGRIRCATVRGIANCIGGGREGGLSWVMWGVECVVLPWMRVFLLAPTELWTCI